MAKYTWISTWFFISAFVIAWDAGYCLSRSAMPIHESFYMY